MQGSISTCSTPAPSRGLPPPSCDVLFVYRLRRWPELVDALRTAPVLRALSRMTATPITERDFIERCGLQGGKGEALLDELLEEGDVLRLEPAANSTQPAKDLT